VLGPCSCCGTGALSVPSAPAEGAFAFTPSFRTLVHCRGTFTLLHCSGAFSRPLHCSSAFTPLLRSQ